MSTLVVVEAPTKAKNLSQYLGSTYKVLASYGHVRDLPTKQGSVKPEDDFALTWAIPEKAEKHLKAIYTAVKKADTLVLATDLDREGEAISWHLLQYLKEQGALRPDLKIERVCFNAVTKESILEALKHPRHLDEDLVEAYLARLSLDYLVGFTLSPVLWKKLPGSKSAGRVQSVALRLVVEREEEIRAFVPQEFWTIHGLFAPPKGKHFKAQLTHFDGTKLEKFSLTTQEQAKECLEEVSKHAYHIDSIEKKKVQRHPYAPFITSSLQQDASRRLGMSPARTMRLAQMLYEGVEVGGETTGLITYMRTDSVYILPEVIAKIQKYIGKRWGEAYLPEKPRNYASSKRAQEAHEAIRPTDITRTPDMLQSVLQPDMWRLYKLIWDRTIACQMASAQQEQTTLIIKGGNHTFRTTGTVIIFDGFLTLYEESSEDDEGDEKSPRLPALSEKDPLKTETITPEQHITQPPARFSEAGLVKRMEELGIGRPSTYARILQVLQDREYVRREKKRLIPEERGHIVVAFLRTFFSRYVDFQFTAMMEDQLDQVSAGEKAWKTVLHDFWTPFIETVHQSDELRISDVLTTLEKDIFPEAKPCPLCHEGTVHLRLGKTGPFVACSRYPDCTYSAGLFSEERAAPQSIGTDPVSEEAIFLKKGPYGWYVECGKKRVSLSTLFVPENLTQDQALWLLSLPRPLGTHPTTGDPLFVGIGRFGPYIKYGDQYAVAKKDADGLMAITLEEAASLVDVAMIRKQRRPKTEKKVFAAKKPAAKKAAPKKAAPKKPASKKTAPTTS